MNIKYDPDFKDYYDALPTDKLRKKTSQKIQFLAKNPRHKSLNFKKYNKKNKKDKRWQFRIDRNWRIWGIRDGDDITLYYIFLK